MAKRENKVTDFSTDTAFFSDQPAMTAQQRKEQYRAEKSAKKQKKRQDRRDMLAEAKSRLTGEDRKKSYILLGVIISVIVLIVLALVLQIGTGGWDAKSGMTYYLDNAETPDLSSTGMTAVINELYYTKNGGMYVLLTLGNGMSTTQHPTKLHLAVYNENDALIASTTATEFPDDYFVVDDGYKTIELHIPSKGVKITDDSLNTISYDISINCEHYTNTAGNTF